MELTPNDKKVVDLLSKLKNSNGAYPSDILAARRQTYLRQVANIGLGIGVSAGLKNAGKGSSNGAGVIATASSKILETILIAAIVIEAGAAAYLYRNKIADLIRTYTGSSNVQVVAPSTDNDIATAIPELIEIVESPSATALPPSGTPSPELAVGSSNDNSGNNASSNINATPNPGGNNGNQYGLTPKPVRTKENNGGNNTSDGGNNDKGGNGNHNKP
jgi:hypothetical protein